jgi:hypothetical protein
MAMILAPLPAGLLADRVPATRLIAVLNVLQACLVACYLVVHSFGPFLALVTLAGLAGQVAGPVQAALIARVVSPQARVLTRAKLRSIHNLGCVAGTGIAALTIARPGLTGAGVVVLLDAASFLGCAAIALKLPRVRLDGARGAGHRGVWRDHRFVAVALLSGVMQIHQTILVVGIPLWLLTNRIPLSVGPAVLTLNTVAVIALQASAARRTATTSAAARVQILAGGAMAAGCACLLLVPAHETGIAVALVVAAGCCLSGGEVLQQAGSWGLVYGLAPDAQIGAYQGMFGVGGAAGAVAGPLCVTAGLGYLGRAAWFALAVVFPLAGLLIWRVVTGRQAPRREPQDPDGMTTPVAT